MADKKKTTSGKTRKSTSAKKKTGSGKKVNNSHKRTTSRQREEIDFSWKTELALFIILGFSIITFIGLIGMGGIVGGALSAFFFGVFGIMAYLFPFLLFFFTAFAISNLYGIHSYRDIRKSFVMKACGFVLLYLSLCIFAHLTYSRKQISTVYSLYEKSSGTHRGGGVFGGVFGCLFVRGFGLVGAVILTILLIAVSLVFLTQKSFFKGVFEKSRSAYTYAISEEAKQKRMTERAARDQERADRLKKRGVRNADRDESLRMNHKVKGVALDTELNNKENNDHLSAAETKKTSAKKEWKRGPVGDTSAMKELIPEEEPVREEASTDDFWDRFEVPTIQMPNAQSEDNSSIAEDDMTDAEPVAVTEETKTVRRAKQPKLSKEAVDEAVSAIDSTIVQNEQQIAERRYVFPPYDLLKKGDPNATGDSKKHLQEMSAKLQMTLTNFGVDAKVTNVICGPTVTQYEIHPEMGVKVSKILNLADDIKLNLAVPDIRIEAPIPGKAAIGIEVPNKENVAVAFRDLVESPQFRDHPSKIAFCTGKDIAGNVIVSDIAKMPHVLIAGSTGSGKSVCINTIIMSILYHADPEDVKLIMIDPKVVELSVYNGIPHLLIPVVTDPKKAAGALQWAVAEMTERYNQFATYGVRDLKGFNKKVEAVNADPSVTEKLKKMPQIVVIVDELADLMMVAPGDVEDAICRLAQLARAAGIHLIIATQRPSVNVITGLIKANMPSRIAFAVTSGVDSRTILDMNGAEKLLGKGDMLFYPQGYAKPLRVQGAFVTDKEVADVVHYIVENNGNVEYNADVEEKMKQSESFMGTSGGNIAPGNERDAYFKEAGKFIIEKEKGSIGMLQRMFKIGFNRAARIMDQLEEAGVVGPEEGTKPRRVLMTMEEFEQLSDD